MPNLITRYTNGTFEGGIGTWNSEFGFAGSAQAQDPAQFFEGANSVKITTAVINTGSFINGSANFLLCRFPGVNDQPYGVTLRIKCNADIPDACFFYADPWSFNTTHENNGFITPVKASFAKAGWVELKLNFYGVTFGGEVVFGVNILFDSVAFNNNLAFSSQPIKDFYSNLATLSVNEAIPAGAFVWIDAMTAEVKAIPAVPDLQFSGRRLYYVENVFYIEVGATRTVIDEPIKWDDVNIQIIFDDKTKAFRFEFSDKDVLLQFDNRSGRQILSDVYKLKGTNAVATLLFGEVDPVTNALTIHYEGSINFESVDESETLFSCNIERQSFGEKLRTYYDTRVDIFREESIGGFARPALTLKELFLHPRLLTYKAEYIYNKNVPTNPALDPQPHGVGADDGIVYVTIPPMKAITNNVPDLSEPSPGDGFLIYSGLVLPEGVTKRKFRIEAGMSFNFTKTGSVQQPICGFGILKVSNFSLGLPTTGLALSVLSQAAHVELKGILAGTYVVSGSFDSTIELEADEALFLRATIYNPVAGSPDTVYSNFNWLTTPAHYLRIQEQTVFTPSLTSGLTLHDTVNRQLELITDKPNVLKSNLLGSVAIGYASDGCAANHLTMDGKMIRKIPNKPFNLSAKDWFNALDGLFCMGMSIERDEDENEFVRLEELSYFFRNVLLLNLKVISNYHRRPASKYLFNELKAGFVKYPQNDQQDSIEDFHTEMSYVTPLIKIKNELSILISAILSGYYIEYTRRESFKVKPTNAYETDNDLFLISSKQASAVHNGQVISFDQDDKVITVMTILPIIVGEKITIAGATGFVTNGTYDVTGVEIPFTYDRVLLTVSNVLATDGAGTGDVTILDAASVPVSRYEAKRDEDFDVVTGVTYPKSVYNLEHHLKRVLIRWAKVFQSGWEFLVTGDPGDIIQGSSFIEGKNNTTVRTRLKNSVACRYGDTLRLDRFDAGTDSINDMDVPLFGKDIIEFDAPVTWTTFNYIRKAFEGRNPDGRDYGYIQLTNPFGEIERGFVIGMKFNPCKQMCKFTLIKKYDGN